MLWKETERESGGAKFTDKLIARILDNLQVSVKNLYFRFEDNVQIRNGFEHCNIGIKLKEFSIYTGDSEYKRINQVSREAPKPEPDDTHLLTYKVAKLEGLSLFCDWNDYFDPRTDFFKLEKLLGEQNPAKA